MGLKMIWRKRLGKVTNDKAAERLQVAQEGIDKVEEATREREARIELLRIKSRLQRER